MFMKRISILIAMISFVLFAFSFGATSKLENYSGLVMYESDFMIVARWYFLWFGISIVISLFYLELRHK